MSGQTTPLRRLELTLEGWLLAIANAALIAAPIVGTVPAGTSIKWGSILNAIAFASRQWLKGKAIQAGSSTAPASSPAPGILKQLELVKQLLEQVPPPAPAPTPPPAVVAAPAPPAAPGVVV